MILGITYETQEFMAGIYFLLFWGILIILPIALFIASFFSRRRKAIQKEQVILDELLVMNRRLVDEVEALKKAQENHESLYRGNRLED